MKLYYWSPSSNYYNLKILGIFYFLSYINVFRCIPVASAQTSLWLNAVCDGFSDSIKSDTRKYTASQQLKELYEKENEKWSPKELQPDEILNSAKNEVERIITSAEQIVETLAEEAESFNKENRPIKDPDALSNQTVRFYDKGENQLSASSKDVFNGDGTLFYYNSKCVCGHQLASGNTSSCYVPDGFYSDASYGGQIVSYNTSAVHIPVDVYNEGPEVLRDVVWSQNLDPTFKSLYCNRSVDSSRVRWSYVATLSGVARYYPASPWTVPCDKIDLYDGRSAHWFVQSMTSPKDVLIMIDSSGSVIGLTLSLVRVSVDHVMKSLTTNDYFNVFVFNKNASFLNPSCPGLLPALDIYKEMFMKWLDDLLVANSSSFDEGFDFAFDVLSLQNSTRFPNSAKQWRARCNAVVLLFTDGGAEYPYDTFQKWNDDQHTRVFTFSVGKHFASTTSLKEIACNNKGVFTSIPSDSATHFQTMEYLVTLSKPLALHGSKSNKWTLPYEDHMGLGRVLTVSRPFFDHYTTSTPSNRGSHKHVTRVAGIAGVDVLYRDVEQALEVKNGGATAYMFGTENNGYLIYHPLLKKARLDSTVTVDLMDIENSNITELRTDMIRQQENQLELVELDKTTLSVDKDHITKSSYFYSYTPISKSLFSIGLAYPNTSRHRVEPNVDEELDWEYVDDEDLFTAAYGLDCNLIGNPPPSCNDEAEANLDDVESMGKPYVILLNNADQATSNCSSLAVDTLMKSREFLLHGMVTRDLMRQPASSSGHVLATFIAADSNPALLRIKHYGESAIRPDIEAALSDPAHKDYFLRPLLTSAATQFYSLIDADDSPEIPTTPSLNDDLFLSTFDTNSHTYTQTYSTPYVRLVAQVTKEFVISEVLHVNRGDDVVLRPAVTGNVMKYDWIKETLFNKTREEVKKCSEETEDCMQRNCWNQDQLCVLLDDGGLLLISNQDEDQEQIGEFFGYVDGDLMRALVKHSLFVSNDIDDHQVVCESTTDDDSSARRSFLIPTLGSILKSGWWFTSSLWFGMQSFFSLLLTSLREVTSQSFVVPFKTDEFVFPNYNAMKHHCVVRKKVFSFGDVSFMKNASGSCHRSFVANRIRGTNLIFVIADLDQSDCSVPYKESDRYSIVTYEGECPPQRFRKEPNKECFNASSEGIETGNDECGSWHLTPSTLLILLLSFIHWLPLFER